MNIQDYVDLMSQKWAKERSETQMTLGELITLLKGLPGETVVKTDTGQGLGEAYSYRGYYSDLSFEPESDATVEIVLKQAEEALGAAFTGYKGGEYVMTKITPLWLAPYGCTGRKLIGAEVRDGELIITTEEDKY